MQAGNRDLAESLEREQRSVRSTEATLQQQLFAEEKKRLSLEAAAREAAVIVEESRRRAEDLIAENEKLQREVVAAKAIPPLSPPKAAAEDTDMIVAALRADISRLQNEKEELVRKSKTVEERYKNGYLVCSRSPPPPGTVAD